MKVILQPGKYVVAVSGGVDSIVLLNLLNKQRDVELIVAHFNHGIRDNSEIDEKFVNGISKQFDLPFEVGYGNLGKTASEAQARTARYKFLNSVKDKYSADAIVTAHHQDDLIETAFINILRGTGFRGLASLSANQKILRPLMEVTKEELINYAKKNGLIWREDVTNKDTTYLRNYLRKNIMPMIDKEKRKILLNNIKEAERKSKLADIAIATLSQNIIKGGKIDRSKFVLLPTEVGHQLIMYWLKEQGFRDFDKKIVGKLNTVIKTALPKSKHNIHGNLWLFVDKKTAYFTTDK